MTQSDNSARIGGKDPTGRMRVAIVVLGIIIGQAILFGPSLIGKRLLLPLNMLGLPNAYLPVVAGQELRPQNLDQTDLIDFQEPERIFAYEEFSAGRFPLWNPLRFGGAPLYTLSYSPLWIPAYFIRSPVILAWVQMLTALVAGVGMYVFCRRNVGVGFWPAAVVAWCYPLTGAFVVWTGYYLPAVMCWLPWMLVAVHNAIRQPGGLGGPAAGLLTAILLVGGSQDIAGQILLVSGIYACWCFFDHYGFRRWTRRRFLALGLLVVAWGTGIAASTWLMLPFNDYIQTGIRMQLRSAGAEERPPVGLVELPQIVLPAMYGANLSNSYRSQPDLVPESSVGAYTGLLATLLLAPLALLSRRHRSLNALMLALLVFSVSWVLNLPGFVQVLRLPVLNMMSHNRLVFVFPLALLALAAVGLEQIIIGKVVRRWWFVIPIMLLILVCGWCVYRAIYLPPEVAALAGQVASNKVAGAVRTPDIAAIEQWFRERFVVAGVLAGIGLAGWYGMRNRRPLRVWGFAALGLLMCGELLYFAYDRTDEADPALYYPPLPVLEQVKQAAPGRIMGFGGFPPNIAQAVGFADIRGYDGVDPARMVELLNEATLHPVNDLSSARTQFMAPIITVDGMGWRVSPILSMLNVRYILMRTAPPPAIKVDFAGDGYWILMNRDAMPRAFVPYRVEVVANAQQRLAKLARREFDPSQVAYVEQPVALPETASGSVTIDRDWPTDVRLTAEMHSPGLLVLSDRWDSGWSAYVNGAQTPVLRVNHAVRGVVLPAGQSQVEFRFAPASLRLGLWISSAAALVLLGWTAGVFFFRLANARAGRCVTMAQSLPRPAEALFIQP